MKKHNFSDVVYCETCSHGIEYQYPILYGKYTCSECNKAWEKNGSKMVICNCEESCQEYTRDVCQ
jgi:hypothetical protein